VFRDRSVLVVVPARGGSKGVPLKNIRPLCGRPLLAYVGDVVREIAEVDRAVVSTDDHEIASIARREGLDVPFLRPPELSGDRVGDWDVLAHALEETECVDGRQYDVIVMLQPTSPLRRPEHVRATLTKLVVERWDAVWTVSPTDLKYHPYKQLTLAADGQMSLHDSRGAAIVARQQLRPVFHRNGVAYAFTRRSIAELKTIMPERLTGLVLTETFVSIDTLADFAFVERIMIGRCGGGTDQ
jgi:CMP-N,N'-diacetyllegionaminic acid synthase